MYKTKIFLFCLSLSLMQSLFVNAQSNNKLIIGRQDFLPGIIMAGADTENRKPNYNYYLFIQHTEKVLQKIDYIWVEGSFYKFKTTPITEKQYDIYVFTGMKMDTIHFVPKSNFNVTKLEILEPITVNLAPKNVANKKNTKLRSFNRIIKANKMKVFIAFGSKAGRIIASPNLIEIPVNVTE